MISAGTLQEGRRPTSHPGLRVLLGQPLSKVRVIVASALGREARAVARDVPLKVGDVWLTDKEPERRLPQSGQVLHYGAAISSHEASFR